MSYLGSKIVVDKKAIEIFERFVTNKSSKILDVGCGAGTFLKSLIDADYNNLFGADVKKNVAYLQLPESHFQLADLSHEKLSISNEILDAVTAWETIEHLENPHHLIREVYRVLKKGGYFIVSIPNPFHIMSKYTFFKRGDLPRWHKNNGHISVFTKGLFYKAFLKNYFDLVKTEYYLGEFPYRFFKYFNYPANEWFGHFIIWIMRKKQISEIHD